MWKHFSHTSNLDPSLSTLFRCQSFHSADGWVVCILSSSALFCCISYFSIPYPSCRNAYLNSLQSIASSCTWNITGTNMVPNTFETLYLCISFSSTVQQLSLSSRVVLTFTATYILPYPSYCTSLTFIQTFILS